MKRQIFSILIFVILLGCNRTYPEANKNSPVINLPFVTGNLPGTPFLFAIPTKGIRPVVWTADGLPEGLHIDGATGIISGKASQKGDYEVHISAENRYGKATGILVIKIGDLLALTPPMGWNSWNTFDINISDSLIRQIADSMVSTGMRDVGYQYINIDDLWQLADRDKNGKIQINMEKFPHGIKALADYVHSKGLKLGIYSDAANLTCGGVAGSYGYEDQDARDFADWGIDLLKYDYCNAPPSRDTAINRYRRMGKALRSTDRSIVFSICEWGEGGIPPHGKAGGRKPYEWAASVGGSYWRTTLDIRNVWLLDVYNAGSNSIMQIVDMNAPLAEYAGPGRWNDPDMLVVGIDPDKSTVVSHGGARGCTIEEYRSHMSLWCLMAAPLLAGNDIRNMSDDIKDILMNTELIAVNQDQLGKQAKKIRDDGETEVFAKPLADGSWAVGLLNRNDTADINIRADWKELGITGEWNVRDLWKHENLGRFADNFGIAVKPHQCVVVRIYKN
jgi:alpha-galactosidase